MFTYQAPGVEPDSNKSQKSNKSKSSIPSYQENAFYRPPCFEKPNRATENNRFNKSQGESQKEKQKQAEQRAQDETLRLEQQQEEEEELKHQVAQQAQQLADDEAHRREWQQQQQKQQQKEAERQQQAQQEQQKQHKQQQEQQSNPASSPSLQSLHINQPDYTVSDMVPVDMIFLRLRPKTNTIDEALLTLPLDSIQRLDSSRIERFDFGCRSNTGHMDIGVLQTLCRVKGLPVTPGYKKMPGAKQGEQQGEPAEGGLDTLTEVLIGQLRRCQDLERWEPKPIHIKCYLRYFRPGDPEDGASTRMLAEIVRKLQDGVGDLQDVTRRIWERWVSDGPPGDLKNFRKFGYREEGEDLECRAPGEWETMYWIEGALSSDSRFYTEVKGRKTQADEGGWKGLPSKRVASPPTFTDPVTGRNEKPRKKPARDSGVGIGDDEEGEEEDEEPRREKAGWQQAQDEHSRKQRERRKRQKEEAAAQPQPQDETLTADGAAQKKELEYCESQETLGGGKKA